MNIAYILHSTTASDGAAKAFLNMLVELQQYDIRPFVVVPGDDGITQEIKARNIATLVLTYRSSAYPYFHTTKERLLFILKLAARIIVNHKATRALTEYVKENKIDIVHSNSSVVRIGFDAAQKAGIPHIYHIREFADMIGMHYFPTKGSFIRQLSLSQSFSICITKAVQSHFYHNDKTPQSRVIYDGVLSKRTDMAIGHAKDFFLFAGRIQPAKGLDQLLEAYKQYAGRTSNPLHLKVAGGCADAAYYNKQLRFVKENNLTALVEFLGNRDDISELMREARALIVSSPVEGFGFSMPEAMQQGCLVIGRNTSGTKEQLDNALEMTGQEVALRYESTEQLALLLAEVADHPIAYYDDYTRKAFDVVNQLYTKENNAKNVYIFYTDILSSTAYSE